MIERILPSMVCSSVAYDDPADAVLFPEERAAVAGAVDKRRREFRTVRWCARRALTQLGGYPVPIVPGDRGAPRWPEGVLGSMTHCDGFRAAAVARAGDVTAIGIDAEPHEPLPDDVLNLIARAEEWAALIELRRTIPWLCWDRVLFSSKESVYKAWFPIAKRWLGFQDASVDLRTDGSFTVAILSQDAPLRHLTGRWLISGGLVTTAIAMCQRPVRSPLGVEKNCVILCNRGEFVDPAVEPILSQDANIPESQGWIGSAGGRVLLERPVVAVVFDVPFSNAIKLGVSLSL